MSFNKIKFKRSARITYSVLLNLFLIFFVVMLVGFTFVGAVGAGYFASLVKDEPIRPYESMKKDIYNYVETTDLYFANDIYLGKLRSDLYREEIAIDDVSDYVKEAIIATEDQYFREHSGIVPKSIIRAILQEFSNSSFKSGGSTLTQQLIKNQILTNEVSFERKAKEIMLALRLERFFNKDEILEAYLNVVPFGRNSSGRNVAGVEAAAQGIFGVSASELSLPQAAYIAGLPQSPFGYTPFKQSGEIKDSIEPSLERMETVLSRMLSVGYISEQQYNDALSYDIRANLAKPKPSPMQSYPWLTTEIESRAIGIMTFILAEKDGYTREDLLEDDTLYEEYAIKADRDLRRNGYKIYTTIDKEIYDKMQDIKDAYEYYGSEKPETITNPDTGEKERILEPVEVGAVLIENSTGRIISFVGGRDHSREQINHATTSLRSNGSTMKPLLVYGPGIQEGIIQPGSPILDIETAIKAGSTTWSPENYDGRYHGLTSARYALAKSYNVPAARIYTKLIDKNPTSYLEKMGFTSLTKGDRFHLSMALGAMDRGVTVEENVNAYATFANYGKFVDAYLIEKIETKEGDVVYEHSPSPVEVFSPQAAFLTLDMMRDVIRRGTAASVPSRLTFKSDWAGKTGTSQDYRDSWFVASNPKITFGLWMGYDTPKSLERSYKGYSYSQRNQKLWAELLNATYELKPELVQSEETFKMPGGIVRRSYCTLSGLLPSNLCQDAGLVQTDLFDIKHVPTKEDNSLVKGNYILVNGKKYRALPETPNEFLQEGIMISKEFLIENELEDLKNLQTLLPKTEIWKKIIVPEIEDMKDNGYTPRPVANVRIEGNTLQWDIHPHPDIVGYRIYKANGQASFKRIATVIGTNQVQYKLKSKNGAFFVTAVDVVGKESSRSNLVTIGKTGLPVPKNNKEENPIDDIVDDVIDINSPNPSGENDNSNKKNEKKKKPQKNNE